MIFRILSILFTTAALTVLPSFATAEITRYQCAGLFFPDTQVNKGQKRYAWGVLKINEQTESMTLTGHSLNEYNEKRTFNIKAKFLYDYDKPQRSPYLIAEADSYVKGGESLLKYSFHFSLGDLYWRALFYRSKTLEVIDVAEFFCSKAD
jgi:hypothetical protein